MLRYFRAVRRGALAGRAAPACPATRSEARPRHHLLLAGVPVLVVAARVGHADPSITLLTLTSSGTSSPRQPTSSPAPSRAPLKLPLLEECLQRALREAKRASELGTLGGTRNPTFCSVARSGTAR